MEVLSVCLFMIGSQDSREAGGSCGFFAVIGQKNGAFMMCVSDMGYNDLRYDLVGNVEAVVFVSYIRN